MKLNDIKVIPYKIFFKTPLQTSQRIYKYRSGFIVKLSANGINGYGEAAPLTGFSVESEKECFSALTSIAKTIKGIEVSAELLDVARDLLKDIPSACFAMETAILDILSKMNKTAMAFYINKRTLSSVKVNFLYHDSFELKRGVEVVKLKIGSNTLSEDIDFVKNIAMSLGPNVKLRLDVNGAWSLNTALEACDLLSSYNIDYLEQPLPPDKIHQFSELRKNTSISIAADESLTNIKSAENLIDGSATDVFVIKPMVSGGFKNTMEIIELAADHGIRSVITSMMESYIGRMALLHLSCAYQITEACGLMTGSLFDDDQQNIPFQENGRMHIGDIPGLGIDYREAKQFQH